MAFSTVFRQSGSPFVYWASLLSRLVLAFVFLAAAIPKLLDPVSFAQTISLYGLVPEGMLLITALLLIAAEIITAAGLLMDRNWSVVAAGGLLLIFMAVLGYGIYLGLDIDCGCFGPEDPEHGTLNSLRISFVRDLFLLIPVSYLLMKRYITGKQER